MTVHQEVSAHGAKLVADINNRFSPSKPSLILSDFSGQNLIESVSSPLPVVLSELSHLFTLVMTLRECDRGAIAPNTRIADVLAPDIVEGLCVVGGIDRSNEITVEHLLSHQSGIADFYLRRRSGTISFAEQSESRDRKWNVDQALEIARHYPAQFTPGAKGRLHYSMTNYVLLGLILQESTGMRFDQLINLRVTVPLNLKGTFVFTESHYDRYFSLAAVVKGSTTLRIPRTLASFGAAGSVVATPKDMVTFAKAWWNGELCDESWRDYILRNQRKLESGLTFGNGVFTAGSLAKRKPRFGYVGSTGQALLIDSEREKIGFLALNTTIDRGETTRLLSSVLALRDKA